MNQPIHKVTSLTDVAGTYFLGRYRVVDEIGVGGMASVHLARMDGAGGFQKWVAIKRIHPHLIEDEHFINMFLDEARIAARISHSNVAQVFDLGVHENTYWIAMEYLHGEPLREVMRINEERSQCTAPELAARIVADAAEGLHAAHELKDRDGRPLNLVHRDVSPHNLFVTYEGMVKVVDFGIAKVSDRMSSTRAGTLKGKLAYMSPEQVRGGVIDRRTDIFALGVVLWELVTGRRLFRMESDLETLERVQACVVPPPSSFVPGFPSELEAIILKALDRRADARYQTARALSRALQQFLIRMGQFIGAEEVSRYVSAMFADRIRQRQDHLRWAAEVTQTISLVDEQERDKGVTIEELSLPTEDDDDNIPTLRDNRPPVNFAALPVFTSGEMVVGKDTIMTAATVEDQRATDPSHGPALSPAPWSTPPPLIHEIHHPAPRVSDEFAGHHQKSVVISTTPPAHDDDDEEDAIETIVAMPRMINSVPVGLERMSPMQAAYGASPAPASGYRAKQLAPTVPPPPRGESSEVGSSPVPPAVQSPLYQPVGLHHAPFPPQASLQPGIFPGANPAPLHAAAGPFIPSGFHAAPLAQPRQVSLDDFAMGQADLRAAWEAQDRENRKRMMQYGGGLALAVVLVVGVGILIGRATSSPTVVPAVTTATASASLQSIAVVSPTVRVSPTAATPTSTPTNRRGSITDLNKLPTVQDSDPSNTPLTTTNTASRDPITSRNTPGTFANATSASQSSTTSSNRSFSTSSSRASRNTPSSGTRQGSTSSTKASDESGYLSVVCTPFCDSVRVGSKSLGPSPVFNREFPAGNYSVKLRWKSGTTKVVGVTVSPGKKATIGVREE